MLQMHFNQIKANLAEIQPEKHQNAQKTHFLQKAPGVHGQLKNMQYGSCLRGMQISYEMVSNAHVCQLTVPACGYAVVPSVYLPFVHNVPLSLCLVETPL